MIDYLCRKVHNLTHPVLGRILMLHRVVEQRSDESEQRELEVTPQFLEQTIKEYQQLGYRFVSINEAIGIIEKTRLSPFTSHLSPFICLTFDDGYHDNYTIAYPLLKRLNVPFAIYVTTGFIDNQLPVWWYPNKQLGMSTEELCTIAADPLCTIGAHTVSHPRLDTLTFEEQRKEIAESKATLEQWLGYPVRHFSYPHGAYNDTTIQIVKEVGFATCLRAWGGTIRRGDISMLELPRIVLKENE
ncbi:MAG: polysaccharide deacetylase family protein [bacterium]